MRRAIIVGTNLTIGGLVSFPLALGWLFGVLIFSFQAGYRSAAVSLAMWSTKATPK